MSKPLYKRLASSATDTCATIGVNKSWLWEEAYAQEIADETIQWISEHVGFVSPEAREDLFKHLGVKPHPEDLVTDIFNLEIVRELLVEINPDVDDETVAKIYSMTGGNPWNAPTLYSIIKILDDIKK